MSMKTLLEVEIEDTFAKMEDLDPTTKEYVNAVDGVTRLMDRVIEIEKLESAEIENDKKLREDRKTRIIKTCVDVGSLVLPLAVTVWGALVSLKFEEEGSITTTIGKKTLDKLFKR